VLATSEPGPFQLGREPLTVTLRVPEGSRARLADLVSGSRPGSLRLFVEGIELLHPGGVFEVHLEAPEGGTPDSRSPSFLGHVAVYGHAGETPESTRTFDVTERLRALWGRGGPSAIGPLRVTFVPGERSDHDRAASSQAPEATLRFRRVALVERPPAPGR
jgi:hypothetical protein